MQNDSKIDLRMKVLSGQHYESLTRKLKSDFNFDPKNGLRTIDLVKGTNFISIGASLKIRVWAI